MKLFSIRKLIASSIAFATMLLDIHGQDAAMSTSCDTDLTPTPILAATNAKNKQSWPGRYTLGPNDVVNFYFYGRGDLTRQNVVIGPDGRVSYLQAQGVLAAGLSIDELRAAMNSALQTHFRNPQVIVTPNLFRSKKIYVLGKVVNKGAHTLDRPMTIIEAVALSGGLETGIFQLNTVELADLPRSFVVRKNQRLPVDLEKLFRYGDLSQNILLEPDDYIYFPSAVANEIYVLGAVKSPGAQGLSTDASVLSTIAVAGGFEDRAHQEKVLVIRGGLEQPERFVVNVTDILAGKTPNFPLQPRDLIYIADRPWARAEEIADLAATSFLQTMVTVWTGSSVGPLIKSPVLPVLK